MVCHQNACRASESDACRYRIADTTLTAYIDRPLRNIAVDAWNVCYCRYLQLRFLRLHTPLISSARRYRGRDRRQRCREQCRASTPLPRCPVGRACSRSAMLKRVWHCSRLIAAFWLLLYSPRRITDVLLSVFIFYQYSRFITAARMNGTADDAWRYAVDAIHLTTGIGSIATISCAPNENDAVLRIASLNLHIGVTIICWIIVSVSLPMVVSMPSIRNFV